MSMRVRGKKSAALSSYFPFSISLKLAVIGWRDGLTSHLGQDTDALNREVRKVHVEPPACLLTVVCVRACACAYLRSETFTFLQF